MKKKRSFHHFLLQFVVITQTLQIYPETHFFPGSTGRKKQQYKKSHLNLLWLLAAFLDSFVFLHIAKRVYNLFDAPRDGGLVCR